MPAPSILLQIGKLAGGGSPLEDCSTAGPHAKNLLTHIMHKSSVRPHSMLIPQLWT